MGLGEFIAGSRGILGRMRVASVGLVIAALAVVLASPAVGATSKSTLAGGDEWPMFGGSFTHAGASQAVGPSSPATSWSLKASSSYSDFGISPAIGSDGTIYQLQGQTKNDLHWRLRAISPTTHKTLWSSTGQGGPFDTTPAVAPDGVVYVAMDGRGGKGLYAIENGGTELWERSFHDGGLDVSPTIGPDGTVYVEDSVSKVYALNPENGHAYWKFAGSTGTFLGEGTPALSPDGTTVYLTTAGGDLYAVSAGPTGGQLAWTYHIQGPTDGGIANAPAVGPDGTIYVATAGNNGNTPGDIEAVNPDGTLKWAYVSNGTFETTPAVTAAGQVVAGNDVGTVVAVQQSDGALAWSYSAPGVYGQNGFYNSSAASDAKGNIYLQNQVSVFAFSPEGSLLWTVNDGGYSSPALDDSGTLYVDGGDQSLIAYESSG
jgi:outer membrane protein assembly factor BamB